MDFSLCLLLLQVISLSVVSASVSRVPALIVFGDSSVDAGNNDYIPTIAKSNFQPYGRDFSGGEPTGRFCNGRLATDFMSEAFGLPPTVPAYLNPAYNITDFATGVCFASAGSGFDDATSDVLSVISLWKQLEHFKEYRQRLKEFHGEEKAGYKLHEALYVISAGTNDFLENYYAMPDRSSQFTIEEYKTFLVNIAESFIKNLYLLGARKIDLTGLCPMGCLPLERAQNILNGRQCNQDYNMVAMDFNSQLQSLVMKLNRKLPGIRIALAQIYDIMSDAVTRPSYYGFDSAVEGCCGTGEFEMGYICNRNNPYTCNDANKYVFWDAFHPTEKMNQIIADYLLNTSLAVFL